MKISKFYKNKRSGNQSHSLFDIKIIKSDASKNFENSFIKSITYETEYSTGNFNYLDHMSPEKCVRTTVSKMYDVVLFIRQYYEDNILLSENCRNPYCELAINLLRNNGSPRNTEGYVFMNKMPTSWTVVRPRATGTGGILGPYVEYNASPSEKVRIRRNGLSIERYCTDFDSNIDCQLLSAKNETYMVYGVMFEDHISRLLK